MVSPEVKLRPMTDEEFDRYRLQSAHEFAAALVAASQAPADDAEERARAETDELLPDGGHSPGMLLLAAEADGTVVGSLWLGERSPKHVGTVWVYDLLVLPAHRGRGYGRAMMLAAEQMLLARGASRIGLNVFLDNDVAHRLYSELGYVPTSQQMTKPLS